jgi:YHS domain-containing protein
MKSTVWFVLLIVTVLFACNNSNNAKAVEAPHKDPATVAKPKQPFEGVEFASKMDLACGMLLSAGIQDTVHYKGKIYGFCSKECKDDFLKTPEAFLNSKYRH